MIRLADKGDSEQIARIHVETWKQAYANIIPDSFLNSLSIANKTENWQLQIEDSTTQISVYLYKDALVGFIAGGQARDEDLKDYSEIYAIYVLPAYQGKGVGSALIDDFFDRHSKPCSLWVLADNKPAIDFYNEYGFCHDNQTKDIDIHGACLSEKRYVILNELENKDCSQLVDE